MKKLAALLCVVGIVGCAMVGWASPATGVTPTVLSRATFDPFHLNRDPHSLVEFEARAKSPLDFVVRQHDYLPHSSDRVAFAPRPRVHLGDERHVDVLRVPTILHAQRRSSMPNTDTSTRDAVISV